MLKNFVYKSKPVYIHYMHGVGFGGFFALLIRPYCFSETPFENLGYDILLLNLTLCKLMDYSFRFDTINMG